jgi:hypothetical protein
MGDPEITGEHEIDIGLRRRPLQEPFLMGPILLRELAPIAQMPGKALAVWLLIRHRLRALGVIVFATPTVGMRVAAGVAF